MSKKYVPSVWQITCRLTPEIIDRLVAPVRKRGLQVLQLSFEAQANQTAKCTLTFESEAGHLHFIKSNFMRITDVMSVSCEQLEQQKSEQQKVSQSTH